jgi:hypothetical protein
MSFLARLFANRFASFKIAPAFTYTYPQPASHSSPAPADSDWEMIEIDETATFYTDRITLFLGPPLKQRHHILITDIPKSSTFLTYLATLDPAQRYANITELDISMISDYLDATNRSVEALAIEVPWLDVIKLALTAEALQDASMEAKALSVLREKGVIANAPGNSMGLFGYKDYAFAVEYWSRTGTGGNLMRVLNQIGGLDVEGEGGVVSGVEASEEIAPFAKYEHGVLEGQILRECNNVEDGAESVVYPVAQPSMPPSVETFRQKLTKNFVWPRR